MDDLEQEMKILGRIRDDLLDLWDRHKLTCDDESCVFKPNVIAFLAHGLGLTTANQINLMESFLDRYNAECPHCTRAN